MNTLHLLALALLILLLRNLFRSRSTAQEQSEIFKIECSNKDKCLSERIGTVELTGLRDRAEEQLKIKDASRAQLLNHLNKDEHETKTKRQSDLNNTGGPKK